MRVEKEVEREIQTGRSRGKFRVGRTRGRMGRREGVDDRRYGLKKRQQKFRKGEYIHINSSSLFDAT